MKKIPYGISNFEELITQNYYYVDKTKYIKAIENLPEKRIMFLRPRKFGKTLFTSTLEYYYDIKAEEKFNNLFANTYIGKNPTELKNSYYVLKFNFSGIDTETEEHTVTKFRDRVASFVQLFVTNYGSDFFVNFNDDAESILDNLFKAFKLQKPDEKIYVIIDEYDHFANELLSFKTDQFKNLVSKNGKVRKWYEILKEGTESVVDRIFITGVAPITLDSLTSGFNITSDITMDARFNEMMGFTGVELNNMIDDLQISSTMKENIIPIMKQNYDGYKFSTDATEQIYNSNMCLFFLKSYLAQNRIPNKFIDTNIASDYDKLAHMLDLCQGEERERIISTTVSGESITSEITEKFNPAVEFTEKELVSMLFYLGYLTIDGEEFEIPKLKIPNRVMKELYSDYLMHVLSKATNLQTSLSDYNEILREIALEGSIFKITELVHHYLENLSNRDFMRFDEKYVKIIFFCIAMNLKIFNLKSEMEVNRKYPDILLIPRDTSKNYCSVMIEFKYLKKTDAHMLAEKQEEARKQIEEYSGFNEIKSIPRLHKYTVVAVNDKIYVDEIK